MAGKISFSAAKQFGKCVGLLRFEHRVLRLLLYWPVAVQSECVFDLTYPAGEVHRTATKSPAQLRRCSLEAVQRREADEFSLSS